jgi:hypothetical protein
MLWFLIGCDGAPDGGESGAPGGEETGTADSGDTGENAPSEIPDGPECGGPSMPIQTAFNVIAGHVVEGTASEAELVDLERLVNEWTPTVGGPWSHAVTGPWSHDGDGNLVGGLDLLQAASVVDVMQRDDGVFVMLFVDGDLDSLLDQARRGEPFDAGLRGFGGLGAATSPDGLTWTPAPLTAAAPFPTYAVDPELLRLSGGGYALYFYGVPAAELCADAPDPFLVPGVHRLYRAESANLLDWSAPVLVFENAGGGTDPALWCVDAEHCFGWFWGGLESSDGGRTFAASDALAFEVTPQVPDVVAVDGGWTMYSITQEGLGALSSEDGRSFGYDGTVGVAALSPSALVVGGETWVYLAGPAPPP